jgi:hypothetical protein
MAPTTPIAAAQREGKLPFSRLRGVHRDHLTRKLARFDRGERVGGHRAGSLHACGFQWLPCLIGDQPRRLLVTASERGGDTHDDLGPLVSRQRLTHRAVGRIDRAARFAGPGLRHPSDDVAGVGGAHLEPVAVSIHSPSTKSFRSVAVAAIVEAYAAGDALRKSGDVNIAYQVVGEGPFDLVYVPAGSRTSNSSGKSRSRRASSSAWRRSLA